jgi:hypothetical protein
MALKDMVLHRNPNPSTIQALIVMTDGQYNQDGDPLARGRAHADEGNYGGLREWYIIPDLGDKNDPRQNLSEYASQNTIRIYTVTFGTDAAIQPGKPLYETMDIIAATTGGTHYHAKDGSELKDVYASIAGQLQQTAGGNTQVTLDFSKAKINDVPGGDTILNYTTYITNISNPVKSTDSTYITKTNLSTSGKLSNYPGYPMARDDTSAWAAKQMNFTVGEMQLNDVWSATFRLNLTRAGKIELFGANDPSEIAFTDISTGSTTHMAIPPLQCNVLESPLKLPFGDATLVVKDLSVTNNGPDPNILTLTWKTTYNGNNTAMEVVSYRNKDISNSHDITVPGGTLFTSKVEDKVSILTVDTTTWIAGSYDIMVKPSAPDAMNPVAANKDWNKKESPDKKYIKLE